MEAIGPQGWHNWAAHAGNHSGERVEVMLYTDAHVTGDAVGLGPYDLLNTIGGSLGILSPAIVLRAMLYERPNPSMEETDTSRFHGGSTFDEIAALVSLVLGMRCAVGGTTRMWAIDAGDPLGRPYEFDHTPPQLPQPRQTTEPIPSLVREVELGSAAPLLSTYPSLGAAQAVALARASRLYQQSVWVASADPSQAWLQLVGALEVASQSWVGTKASPTERLGLSWPAIADALKRVPESSSTELAAMLAPTVKSTWRFLRFMDKFMPDLPIDRPPLPYQLDWTEMPDHLAKIYDFRSRALHLGEPFPPPMCEPPTRVDGESSETPIGISTFTLDGSWLAEDTPMLLSTFEYIARNTLLRWWQTLGSSGSV